MFRLRLINRAIVPALNLALTFMFMMVGILLIASQAAGKLLIGQAADADNQVWLHGPNYGFF